MFVGSVLRPLQYADAASCSGIGRTPVTSDGASAHNQDFTPCFPQLGAGTALLCSARHTKFVVWRVHLQPQIWGVQDLHDKSSNWSCKNRCSYLCLLHPPHESVWGGNKAVKDKNKGGIEQTMFKCHLNSLPGDIFGRHN